MRTGLICVVLLVLLLPSGTIGQSSRLEFEVASVKRNKTGSGSSIGGTFQGDRFYSTNVTVSQLVRNAYGVQEFQIAGQPGWFDTEKFDVEAKLDRETNDIKVEDALQMLQSLLADRFKLALHRESKDVPVFALLVARNGAKLTPADPSKCNRTAATGICGFRASPSEIIGTGVSMEQLATRLSRSLGRMVINKTDLKGEFDLKVEWTPDQTVPQLGPGASAGPALFAAIQDQLGLRLESSKAPVETLVIDRVERPSEN